MPRLFWLLLTLATVADHALADASDEAARITLQPRTPLVSELIPRLEVRGIGVYFLGAPYGGRDPTLVLVPWALRRRQVSAQELLAAIAADLHLEVRWVKQDTALLTEPPSRGWPGLNAILYAPVPPAELAARQHALAAAATAAPILAQPAQLAHPDLVPLVVSCLAQPALAGAAWDGLVANGLEAAVLCVPPATGRTLADRAHRNDLRLLCADPTLATDLAQEAVHSGEALLLLARLAPAQALPLVKQGMGERLPRGDAAVRALAYYDFDTALPLLLPRLPLNYYARSALARFEDPRAVEVCRKLMQPAQTAGNEPLLVIVGNIGGSEAAKVLLTYVREGPASSRAVTFDALAATGAPEAVEALTELLRPESRMINYAAPALGRMGMCELLIKALNESDERRRPMLLVSLEWVPGPESLAILTPAAARGSRLRAMALRALRTNPDPAVLPLLVAGLEAPEGDVRTGAITAAVAFPGEEVLGLIEKAMADPETTVASPACAGARRLPLERRMVALTAALAHASPQVRRVAVIVLADTKDARCGRLLEQAAEDPDPQVREVAVRYLKQFTARGLTGAPKPAGKPPVAAVAAPTAPVAAPARSTAPKQVTASDLTVAPRPAAQPLVASVAAASTPATDQVLAAASDEAAKITLTPRTPLLSELIPKLEVRGIGVFFLGDLSGGQPANAALVPRALRLKPVNARELLAAIAADLSLEVRWVALDASQLPEPPGRGWPRFSAVLYAPLTPAEVAVRQRTLADATTAVALFSQPADVAHPELLSPVAAWLAQPALAPAAWRCLETVGLPGTVVCLPPPVARQVAARAKRFDLRLLCPDTALVPDLMREAPRSDDALVCLARVAPAQALPFIRQGIGQRWSHGDAATRALAYYDLDTALPLLIPVLGTTAVAGPTLARFEDVRGIEECRKLLPPPQQNVIGAVDLISAIGGIGGSAATQFLIERLREAGPNHGAKIVAALAATGTPEAITELQRLLAPETRLASPAAQGLGRLGLLEVLLKALDGADEDRRWLLLPALAWVPGPEALAILKTAATDPAARIRASALRGLGYTTDPAVVPVLAAALEDPDAQVRFAATIALYAAPSELATPLFEKAVKDADENTALFACGGVNRLPLDRRLAAFAGALKHPSPKVRGRVVELLATTEDPRCYRALEQAAQDPDPQVRDSAATALKKFTASGVTIASEPGGKPIVTGVEAATAQASDQELWGILKQAGKVPAAQLEAPLRKALASPSANLRVHAAGVIYRFPDPRFLPLLAPALKDADHNVRRDAVRALGEIGGPEVVPALVAASADPEHYTREAALTALVRRDPATATALFRAALDGVDDDRALQAVRMLPKLGPPALPLLGAALDHTAGQVRQQAAQEWYKLDPEGALAALGQRLAHDPIDARRLSIVSGLTLADAKVGDLLFRVLREDPAPEVRRLTLPWPRVRAPERAAQFLNQALDDPEAQVRTAALSELALLKDAAFIPRLVRLVQEASGPRTQALAALVAAGDPGFAEVEKLFGGDDLPLRRAILAALPAKHPTSLRLLEGALREPALAKDAANNLVWRFPTEALGIIERRVADEKDPELYKLLVQHLGTLNRQQEALRRQQEAPSRRPRQ